MTATSDISILLINLKLEALSPSIFTLLLDVELMLHNYIKSNTSASSLFNVKKRGDITPPLTLKRNTKIDIKKTPCIEC